MMVPAVTIKPPLNLARAKFLASASVSNVSVKRGFRRFTTVPFFGTSKVTYQVCCMPDPSAVANLHDDLC